MKKSTSQQKQNKMIASLILFLFYLFFSPILFASINQKSLPSVNVIIEHDQRPADLEYALMSKYAYKKNIQVGDKFDDLFGWKVFRVVRKKENNDYRGVVFRNVNTRQIVVAHRGTNPISIKSIWEDIDSIVMNNQSAQRSEVFVLVQEMIKYAKDEKYRLSFTGHSLGAFLAELSVFYCHDHNYPLVNAVTFESPGCKEAIVGSQTTNEVNRVKLEKMDIISYVGGSKPNLINTFNTHIGSLYQINTDLGKHWRFPANYTLRSHSIDRIVECFKTQNKFYKSNDFFSYYLYKWPVADWIEKKNILTRPTKSLRQLFFALLFDDSAKANQWQWNKKCNCYQVSIGDKNDLFDLTYKIQYQVEGKYNPRRNLPLRHFGQGMKYFLTRFWTTFWDIMRDNDDRQKLVKEWVAAEIPEEITGYLNGFKLIEIKGGPLVSLPDSMKFTRSVAPIHEFRDKLSKYLHDNQDKIRKIFSSVNESKSRFKEMIDVVAIEGGAVVKGTIEGDVIAVAVDASLHDVYDKELIEAYGAWQRQFIQDLSNIKSKVRVRGIEKGAKVGEIKGKIVVKGVDISAVNSLKQKENSSKKSYPKVNKM